MQPARKADHILYASYKELVSSSEHWELVLLLPNAEEWSLLIVTTTIVGDQARPRGAVFHVPDRTPTTGSVVTCLYTWRYRNDLWLVNYSTGFSKLSRFHESPGLGWDLPSLAINSCCCSGAHAHRSYVLFTSRCHSMDEHPFLFSESEKRSSGWL